MKLLAILTGLLATRAAAATIDTAGTSGPGVSAMWGIITSIFPYAGVGKGALVLIAFKIISFILSLIGGAATVVLIYAGIRLVISHGEEEGVSEAKKTALYALLGVVLALMADLIVFFVCSELAPRLVGGAAPGACRLIF